jgi:nitrate reductase delta subunit
MSQNPATRRLYRLFADALTYPTPKLGDQARECAALLSSIDEEAAGHLQAFAEWAEQTPPGRLEEIYTGTFDLQVVCFPYVGYQLFGESYKRGAFLAKLNEEYRSRGFSAERELPDHLAVILRFLAVSEEDDVTHDLVSECVAPALERMKRSFEGATNPYSDVIQALSLLLRGTEAVLTEAQHDRMARPTGEESGLPCGALL